MKTRQRFKSIHPLRYWGFLYWRRVDRNDACTGFACTEWGILPNHRRHRFCPHRGWNITRDTHMEVMLGWKPYGSRRARPEWGTL